MNYPSLRYLLETYGRDGFVLLAAPCNQFPPGIGQAPGTDQEEREAAWRKFGIEFPVLDKVNVNGPNAHPLYNLLREEQPVSFPTSSKGSLPTGYGNTPGALEWNYVKFLVDRNGHAVKRFKPTFDPIDFEGDVRLLLAGKNPLPAECAMKPGKKGCNVERLMNDA